MNPRVRNTPALFESLESRLQFSIIPAPAISHIVESKPVHIVGDGTPVVAGTGLTGEFFAGNNFQTPMVVRTDSVINFRWTSGKPDQDIPKGLFSARWTGQIQPATTGSYTFYTNSDSGTRVTVNDIVLFDNLTGKKPSVQSGSIVLTAGENYDVKVEYASRKASVPRVQFLWSTTAVAKQLVPKSVLFPDTTVALPASALSGTYYQGDDFGTEVMARSDPSINFNWGTNPPDLAIPPHTPFSVRWLGKITVATTGLYTFKSVADDGVRLWVNGQLIIDHFVLDSGTPRIGKIMLTAGKYDLREDYFEGPNKAEAKLLWATPGQHKYSYVPFTVPAPVVTGAPTNVVATDVSSTAIDVTWADVPGASGFIVQRSSDGGATFQQVATTTSGVTFFHDTGLTPNTTYEYQILATDVAGNSAASNVASAGTIPASPVLTATVKSASLINLQWTDVAGESGFIIQESPDGTTGWSQIASTSTSIVNFPVAGLTANTPYFFRVLAIGTTGDSAPSNIATGTTGPANPSYASLTTMYGLTGSGKVYSIDTTDGAAAQIGTLSFGTNAAGRDPYSSSFFYVSTGSSTAAISIWSPFDGSNTVSTAGVSLSGPVAQAAFASDGTFFLTTDIGDLYAYNTDTATIALKGNIHAHGVTLNPGNGDIAFAPSGTLYLETSSELYSIPRSAIDAGTGSGSIITATDIGSTGTNLQLAFGQNGVLFGTDANGQLYSVDPATAAITPIGTPSGINVGDLASVPLYPDLTINQTSSSFVRGTSGTYTLTAANAGPTTTVGPITMIDTLPAGVTYVGGTGTGWTFNVNGQTVTMVYSQNVAAGASPPVVTLNVAVEPSATNTVTNAVMLSTTVFETDTANDNSSLDTSITG